MAKIYDFTRYRMTRICAEARKIFDDRAAEDGSEVDIEEVWQDVTADKLAEDLDIFLTEQEIKP